MRKFYIQNKSTGKQIRCKSFAQAQAEAKQFEKTTKESYKIVIK